jgi:hypothetical protein
MNPPPFVTNPNDPFSSDRIQARLALPFHKPFIKAMPFNRPVLQPMPDLKDLPAIKGYFLGGLFPSQSDIQEKMRQIEEERKKPSLRERINQWGNDPANQDFVQSLRAIYFNK